MTVRIYNSTDSGAPTLTGQASSLISLLSACLVDGYGSKAAAGWSKPYTGTNLAAFRNTTSGGSGMYLRVNDAGGGTGGTREALVRGYATMSDVNTGTAETPTTAQVSTSIVWRKSNTTDSTARPWIVIADDRTFYLNIDTGTLATEYGTGLYGAGDIASHVPGDAYAWFIAGRESQHAAGQQGTHRGLCTSAQVQLLTPSVDGFWLPRGYAGTGSPLRAAISHPSIASASSIGAFVSGALARPTPGSGVDLWVPSLICNESTIRGVMRGLYTPINDWSGTAMGTERSAPPGLPSGVLVAMRHCSSSTTGAASTDCHIWVDRVGPWS